MVQSRFHTLVAALQAQMEIFETCECPFECMDSVGLCNAAL